MWEALAGKHFITVRSVEEGQTINCKDNRFARVLAHILNTVPSHKLKLTDEEMDRKGVTPVYVDRLH